MKIIPANAADLVYHYTSIETMLKIVDQRSIHCTAISYLNDVSEQRFFMGVARKRLDVLKRMDETIPKYLDLDVIREDDTSLVPELSRESFVASFSASGDSLLHWRAYCPQQSGISIGFRVENLAAASMQNKKTPNQERETTFGAIEYIDEVNSGSVDELIREAIWKGTRSSGNRREPTASAYISAFVNGYISAKACLKKHRSFEFERESRLLIQDVRGKESRICYRPVRSTLVPFVPLYIPNFEGSAKPWNAIKEIVVGPSANLPLSLRSIASYFKAKGMTVDVRASIIPFRDW